MKTYTKEELLEIISLPSRYIVEYEYYESVGLEGRIVEEVNSDGDWIKYEELIQIIQSL